MKLITSLSFALLIITLNFLSISKADQQELINYNDAKDIFWTLDYNRTGTTLYCYKTYTSKNGLNIEHVFAAGWMKEVSGCPNSNRKECRKQSPMFNRMEADLHNLYPTVSKANSIRGSLTFGIIDGISQNECDFEVDEQSFEPPPSARGAIARALLYMSNEYGADLNKAAEASNLNDLVTYWHCNYPVEQKEIERNKQIFEIQGTDNPFVSGRQTVNCQNIKTFATD